MDRFLVYSLIILQTFFGSCSTNERGDLPDNSLFYSCYSNSYSEEEFDNKISEIESILVDQRLIIDTAFISYKNLVNQLNFDGVDKFIEKDFGERILEVSLNKIDLSTCTNNRDLYPSLYIKKSATEHTVVNGDIKFGPTINNKFILNYNQELSSHEFLRQLLIVEINNFIHEYYSTLPGFQRRTYSKGMERRPKADSTNYKFTLTSDNEIKLNGNDIQADSVSSIVYDYISCFGNISSTADCDLKERPIIFETEKGASFEIYSNLYNEIKKGYFILWSKISLDKFDKQLNELNHSQHNVIRDIAPLYLYEISYFEPEEYLNFEPDY